MTTPPRRRDNDKEAADLYPKVEEAVHTISRVEEQLVAEISRAAEIHAGLAPLNHVHETLEVNVNQIIDVLEGPAVRQLFGQPPVRGEGLVDKVGQLVASVTAIEASLGNGGLKIKLPVGAWVAIVVAILAGVFQVVSAALIN